jgi:hypothetical protein
LGSIKFGIIDDPTNINETAVLPSEYCLNQNFPNPFNPRTNISFLLPKSGNVSLKIFNIVGQDIATLVNEKMDVGSFNIDFDASNLNSGIYFYRLVAGKFTETKKMILLK